jgi:hypothetical protein
MIFFKPMLTSGIVKSFIKFENSEFRIFLKWKKHLPRWIIKNKKGGSMFYVFSIRSYCIKNAPNLSSIGSKKIAKTEIFHKEN